MFHGKIAQFRVVPFFARTKLILSDKIEDLIDMSREKLDALADDDREPDKYEGKDLQFHKIKLDPNWQEQDEDELSEEYVSDEEPEDESLEPTPAYNAVNPRRSTRKRA
jgi:hypothetical protein